MKKAILFSFIFLLSAYPLLAQKFELKINPGINFTFVPDFTNQVLITHGGLVIPNLVVPGNSVDPPIIGIGQSYSNAKLGFFADMEIALKLGEKFKLSLACGINQMKYNYDTYVDFDDAPPTYLSELSSDYGNTNLLFIDLKPINFSYGLFDHKLSLQAGPVFSFLVNSEQNNLVIRYSSYVGLNGQQYDVMDKLWFDSTNDLNKVLYGCFLRTAFKIIKPLDLFVSGQFYFTSICNKTDADFPAISDTKPIQLQLGLSYTFWNFGKNKNGNN